jgi:hypothetical protein
VQDHGREEDGVDVGKGGVEARGQRPRQRHDDVARVVDLARVLPPAVNQQGRAAGRCNIPVNESIAAVKCNKFTCSRTWGFR